MLPKFWIEARFFTMTLARAIRTAPFVSVSVVIMGKNSGVSPTASATAASTSPSTLASASSSAPASAGASPATTQNAEAGPAVSVSIGHAKTEPLPPAGPPDPAFAGIHFPMLVDMGSTPFHQAVIRKTIEKFRAAGLDVEMPSSEADMTVSIIESVVDGRERSRSAVAGLGSRGARR